MNSNRALQTWIPRILVVNFILILAVDLFPFDYDFSTGWSWDEITQSFTSDTIQGLEGSTEVLMALLLYLPFGFCVAGWLYLKGFKPWGQLAIAGLICGLIALLGETLQEFSPSRHANFSDVLSSIVWATVGIIGFVGLRSPILRGALFLGQFLKRWLSAPQLIASFMGYFALVLIVSWTLQQSFLLSNWETDYPLIMGNERTADRPWQGQITELCFADQAIPQPELTPWIAPEGCPQVRDSLFTRYQFDQGSPYSDQQGNSPELIWSGATPVRTQPEQRGVMIDSQHWLTTAEPMANLSEQLRQTSQFTVGLTVATAQLNQDGPARMVSISNGPI
ncbi:MAG: VanZ family protein [Oscillatoriales cyanobacterium RM1_1_9]|nr:VanZ family protein [Oscillatoriales cyanobacterium RM1_1_9]